LVEGLSLNLQDYLKYTPDGEYSEYFA